MSDSAVRRCCLVNYDEAKAKTDPEDALYTAIIEIFARRAFQMGQAWQASEGRQEGEEVKPPSVLDAIQERLDRRKAQTTDLRELWRSLEPGDPLRAELSRRIEVASAI